MTLRDTDAPESVASLLYETALMFGSGVLGIVATITGFLRHRYAEAAFYEVVSLAAITEFRYRVAERRRERGER